MPQILHLCQSPCFPCSHMYWTWHFLSNKMPGLGISLLALIMSKKGLSVVERLLQIPVMFCLLVCDVFWHEGWRAW